MLAGILTDFKDALMTGCAGSTRPANLQAGGLWVDTSKQTAPDYYWAFDIYDGTNDIEIFRISILNGFGGALTADSSFSEQNISASTTGPILELIKRRIANNGQVFDGDVVAEIKFVGRTNTSTNPALAYLRFTATDNMTATASGGTFSMFSTPDGTAAVTENLRLINGMVETFSKLKTNSYQPVSQNVATAASITQLNSDFPIVEMTGATTTNIHGLNALDDSKFVTIHNRSTAVVTIKHQSGSATAVDRFKLPGSADAILVAEGSATFFYCVTDSRWKLLCATSSKVTKTVETIDGVASTWTAPSGAKRIKITGFRNRPWGDNIQYSFLSPYGHTAPTMLDVFGNAFTWGDSSNGNSGLGDINSRSSPVLLLGGLTWKKASIGGGIAKNGSAYTWGINNAGQLGVGDVVPRSSPVAVIGGYKFADIVSGSGSIFGITEDGSLYSWGSNSLGQLGDGTLVDKSSPVVVLGGLKFAKVFSNSSSGPGSVWAITRGGDLYAWGGNATGQLGDGTVISRSSPVAVLGGLKWKKVVCTGQTNQTMVLGLTSTGDAYGWGSNLFGSVGDGTSTPRSSPVAVLGGLTFKDIQSTGQAASMFGLTTGNDLYSWGRDSQSQLGHGTFLVNTSSPVAVIGGFKFSSFAASQQHVIAIEKDTGAAYAWGIASSGELGTGSLARTSSPVAVLGGLKFESVYALASCSYGITLDGILYGWGINTSGKLGVGDTVSRSSPVQVLGALGSDVYMNKPTADIYLEVVGGTVYNIVLGSGNCTFGTATIGRDLERIVIESEA